MPPESQGRHPELRERSAKLLGEVRQRAHSDHGYISQNIRDAMNNALKAEMKSDARPWQLDVAEALLLKLDCLVIAGTGSGKTIPFMLPLLLPQNKSKVALIISPLLSLQAEQVNRFNSIGVPAVAVNHHTLSKELLSRLSQHEFQVVLAGPEMILENDAVGAWLKLKRTLESILFVAIDEAHLIKLWGAEFRPHYDLLAGLHSLLPTHIPVLATSATITPDTEKKVCSVLEIDYHKAYYVNLGNDRPNIMQSVHLINSSKDYAALMPFLPKPTTPPRDWPKTQIFVNTVMESQIVCDFLIAQYPDSTKQYIDYIHSTRTPAARRRRLRRFRNGTIKLLVSTEIGALGQDIPDITQVIGFGAAESPEAHQQHMGRAVRMAGMLGFGRLLIERSCFEAVRKGARKKAKKASASAVDAANDAGASAATSAPAEDDKVPFPVLLAHDQLPNHLQWRKMLDPGLRLFAAAQRCRRDVADEYFGNPPHSIAPSGRCCDICEGTGPFPLLPVPLQDGAASNGPERPQTPPGNAPSTPATTPNKNGKRARVAVEATGPKVRAKTHLADAKSAIRNCDAVRIRQGFAE